MGEGTQCEESRSVELTSIITKVKGIIVELNWITETKVDIYGFEILLCIQNINWKKIGFTEGHVNSNTPKLCLFVDKKQIGGCKLQ